MSVPHVQLEKNCDSGYPHTVSSLQIYPNRLSSRIEVKYQFDFSKMQKSGTKVHNEPTLHPANTDDYDRP